jgi:hypothetical protein
MFKNQLASEWKYKWFGIWGAEKKTLGFQYQKEDYIDTSCPAESRKKIASYLHNSPFALVAQQPAAECPFCGEDIYLSAYKSDGIWLWTDSLAHYVEHHDFCIPNAMAEHILLLDGIPPKDFDIDVKDLPWP